jgi:predicted lipoprotein with Yx(FWY)xxD motif
MRISSVRFLPITLALVMVACSSTPAAPATTAPAAVATVAATPAGAASPSAAATSAATTPTTAAATTAGSPTAAATTAATSATTTSLQFATDPTLGKILTDGNGMTLYQYAKDTKDTSACTGQCATAWPPLSASATPAAPAGDSGTIGLITRPDGTKQVTYNGLPLYHFAKDTKQGDATGQGLAGAWKVVQPGNAAPAA